MPSLPLNLSPTASIFIALLVAVGGLYLLRIPQAARTMSEGFTALSRAQERKIKALETEVSDLLRKHEDCEKRSDQLERRIAQLEGRRR